MAWVGADEWEDDNETFALVRPLNDLALDDFHDAVEYSGGPQGSTHHAQFIHLNSSSMVERESNLFSEDEGDCVESPKLRWDGSYKLSLMSERREDEKGWQLGTERGHTGDKGVDILLAPPKARQKIAGRHCLIYLHSESYRIMLRAKHTIFISGNGLTALHENEEYVLEHGAVIQLGNNSYMLEITSFYKSATFEQALRGYMEKTHGELWSFNGHVSPASVQTPQSLCGGLFLHAPSSFAAGAFGNVTAGWKQGSGQTVAIKQFKNPEKGDVEEHVSIMREIKRHPNIAELIHYEINPKSLIGSFCVYSPLAVANLAEVVRACRINDSAKWILIRDFVKGLTFLHLEIGVMHRDLSSRNLCIVSFNDPRGLIIDLDATTRDATSDNHMIGTLPFLAPETIALKERSPLSHKPLEDDPINVFKELLRPNRKPPKNNPVSAPTPPNYTEAIDVWALGLNVWALWTGLNWKWSYFGMRGVDGQVSVALYESFRQELHERRSTQSSLFDRKINTWVSKMVMWDLNDRITAQDLLEEVNKAAHLVQGRALIKPRPSKSKKRVAEESVKKSSPKRPAEKTSAKKTSAELGAWFEEEMNKGEP